MKVKNILQYLESKFPIYLASNFDEGKIGLQIGNLEAEVSKVLVALDGSEQVILEAIKENVDLLITHHPFLYSPVISVDYQEALGRKLLMVFKNELNIICMHTNLDVASGGMNDYLAMLLKLDNIRMTKPEVDHKTFIRIGEIDKKTLEVYAKEVAKTLGETPVRIVGHPDNLVRTIGIVGGSGTSEMMIAKNAGCDVFITGDIKHHQALEAIEMGLCLIEVNHTVEQLYMKKLASDLRKVFPKLIVIDSQVRVNPFIEIK